MTAQDPTHHRPPGTARPLATAGPPALAETVIDIERHAAASGWDHPPRLYALVETAELLTHEPQLAALGLGQGPGARGELDPGRLTPIEQEDLESGPLDEVLARISWPSQVLGCALVQEIVMMPPGADGQPPAGDDPAAWTAGRPDRREARLVVGVLRDGTRAAALRVRPRAGSPEAAQAGPAQGDPTDEQDILTGGDLAPNLADALLATLD